jgi:hypothetical protein
MDLSDVLVGFGVVELETERGPGRIWPNPTRPTKYRLAPNLGDGSRRFGKPLTQAKHPFSSNQILARLTHGYVAIYQHH